MKSVENDVTAKSKDENDDTIKTLVEKVNLIETKLGNIINDNKDLSEKPASISTTENDKEIKEKSIQVERDKQKLFTCNLCNFSTQSKQGMKSHKTKKHKEVMAHCGFCDLDFTSSL